MNQFALLSAGGAVDTSGSHQRRQFHIQFKRSNSRSWNRRLHRARRSPLLQLNFIHGCHISLYLPSRVFEPAHHGCERPLSRKITSNSLFNASETLPSSANIVKLVRS
ncbi:hypothetical protein CEXT_253651 [Caerostris extrusa]|uniref:Uncharacterized protein n=1 Tax=Caerostris extrusa TaxID=172846 RepID=A0AAV4Q451_CAEEX|nr:hypothetical protein CEXT_253651 [Caerostris extrusa]